MLSTTDVVIGLRRFQLLTHQQFEELTRQLQEQAFEPRALARLLIDRGWLTPYQANLLLTGRGEQLLLGSYVLLEKLGEGGMGIVYKARNWKLGRTVALKLIRKERLQNADVVKRFEREVRIAAQLSHANVVLALDADQACGATFMVMEYVEGTDLARLVKEKGPLPVALACEYVRQAALGLQHAFERGLVHRDIKPSNLLLQKPVLGSTTGGPAVKILDLGLARLRETDDRDSSVSTLTIEGAFMGTPDYIAPEQALNSHNVDIRADLYSLGCTFYYVLTGLPPFPGGSLGEKLLKHQMYNPATVESVRPDTPAVVAQIVARLMAKDPAHRYQTPAELALALEKTLASSGEESPLARVESKTAPVASPDASPQAGSASTDMAARDEWAQLTPTSAVIAPPPRATSSRPWPVLIGLLLLAGGIWWVTRPTDQGKAPPDEQPSSLAAGPVTEEWIKTVRSLPAEKQVAAVKAKLVELNLGFDGTTFTAKIEKDAVTSLDFSGQNVTDLSPLRALAKLRELRCPTVPGAIVCIVDLSPLQGLPLAHLDVTDHRIGDLKPLKGMTHLRTLVLNGTRVESLAPLAGLALTSLNLERTPVRELAPLKGATVYVLDLSYTPVESLAPLAGNKLEHVRLTGCNVRDLGPLHEAPLESLQIGFTPVEDLTPLAGMKTLRVLHCQYTPVRSLAPLSGATLKELRCHGSAVTDYSPLQKVELSELQVDFVKERDLAILAGLNLKGINFEEAGSFFRRHQRDPKLLDEFVARVNKLKPDAQVREVLARLKELNPGSDQLTANPTFDRADVMVTGLELKNASMLSDISPLRALPGLERVAIDCLPFAGARLADLSSLRGLPIRELDCRGSPVFDLSPLMGMQLNNLNLSQCANVDSLKPLQGMPLMHLAIQKTLVTDLSPLLKSPLESLQCSWVTAKDAAVLRQITTLKKINGRPAEEILQKAGSG